MNSQPLAWMLAQVMCPIVFLGTYFHFGVMLYWVLVANAATYAVIGMMIEGFRRQMHDAA
jgi:hypothetical protein